MNWLLQLHSADHVAHAIGVLGVVCMAGMALGSVKLRGVGLGSAGVLFAGILAGHFGKPVDKATLDFVKEFGLILFVFTIGLQQGPGFFATLRQQGLKLNALAAANVLLAAVLAPFLGWLAGFDSAAVLGVFSGASVNMPSLGAATQTLNTIPEIAADRLAMPAMACAVTFPAAIFSSICALLLLKWIFRIDPQREEAEHAARLLRQTKPLEHRTLVVTNPNLDEVCVDAIPGKAETGVTISRVRHDGLTRTAVRTSVIRYGDAMVAVGTGAGLDQFERVVGKRSTEDLVLADSPVTVRRVVVTAREALGRTVGEIGLDGRFGVAVTRITRSGMEMPAVAGLRVQFGDVVQLVGGDKDLGQAADALGNSLKELDETHFIPLFIGIVLGVVLGTVPIALPGIPQPVRLGLAGGPLIVALLLGRIGRLGPLVCHMPANANRAFREFGMALFFAAVGLDAGGKFFATVFSITGVRWLLAGVCVSVVPLVLTGILARVVCRMNFADLSGLLAGSTTNPPALSFAASLSGSDTPTVAYAAVYPLTMLLRVLCAQVMALALFG